MELRPSTNGRKASATPVVPTPAAGEVVASVEIPHDIETLRREAPTDASAWRLRVREQFTGHLAAGLRIGGFDDERGYLLVEPR